MKTIINKRLARDYALTCAKHRSHPFTIVGKEFYIWLDGVVKAAIASRVQSLPSKGKTIK